MSDATRLKSTVYVDSVGKSKPPGGLDTTTTKEFLHQAFLPFGEIVEIQLPLEDRSGITGGAKDENAPHRGFAYVEFESSGDAVAAIDNMDQAMLQGKVLKVAAARPMKESGEGLGSKVAVWNQESWLAKYEVSEEDRLAAEKAKQEMLAKGRSDPMQGLNEDLEIAGPQKPE